jgi:hypothetical protein
MEFVDLNSRSGLWSGPVKGPRIDKIAFPPLRGNDHCRDVGKSNEQSISFDIK